MNATSPYAQVAGPYLELGYSVVTIKPGTKAPGQMRRRKWQLMPDWREEYSNRRPTRFEHAIWCTWPDAGVGLVSGPASGHAVGMDIDTDDGSIRGAILSALPPTTLIKRGKKGETRFFRGPKIARSKTWRIGEQQVADLIGPGRQTVLPPSIHPETVKPYQWIGGGNLEDLTPDDLPELTPAHIAAIDEALRPLGYKEPQLPSRGPSVAEFACDDKRGREWGLAVLRGEAGKVARAGVGSRNTALRDATATVAGKPGYREWVAKQEAWDAMYAACISNGYLEDDGEGAFAATFNGRWDWGLAHPLPGPRERLFSDPEFASRIKLTVRGK